MAGKQAVYDVFTRFRIDAKNWDKNLNKLSRSLTRTGRNMSRAGANLTKNLTLPLALAGGAAVKFAVDLEQSFAKIENLVGISTEALSGFTKEVRRISDSTGEAQKSLADALFVVTSAGVRGAEAIQILEQASKASAAGLGETAEIARTVTAVLQAYGKENITAARATDILFSTVREGNLEAESLAGALGPVLGLASKLGVSFEEVGANIATFTRLGVTAEQAATSLQAIFSTFLKPTDGAKKALKEFGLTAQQVRDSISKNGLADTLIDLVDRVGDNDEAIGEIIPNIRALRGVLGTAGVQAESYADILRSIATNTDLVDDAFKNVSQTASQKFKVALANLQNVAVELGNILVPIAISVVDKITAVVNIFKNFDTGTKKIIVTIALFAAALGPVVFILGSFLTALGVVVGPIGIIAAGAGLLAAAILGMGLAAKKYSDTKFAEEVLKLKDNVASLEKKLPPLIKIYDSLSSKTERTEKENKKLNEVMQSIASIVPEAVSAWDANGKALEINVTQAGKFLEVQRALLNLKNAQAIEEQTEALKRFESGLASVTKKLNEGEQITVGSSLQSFKLTGDRLQDALERQANYNKQIDETKLLLAGLSGQYEKYGIVVEKVAKAIPKTTPVAPVQGVKRTINDVPGGADLNAFSEDSLGRLSTGSEALNVMTQSLATLGVRLEGTSLKWEALANSVIPKGQAMAEVIGGLLSNAFSGLGNAIISSFENGKEGLASFGQFFVDFAKGLLAKMISLIATAVILSAVLSTIGFGAGAGGAIKQGISFGKSIGNLLKSGLGVPSLAVGTNFVNRDGLAMLHRGEEVKPAGVKGGGFSGGGMLVADTQIKGGDIYLVWREEQRKRENT